MLHVLPPAAAQGLLQRAAGEVQRPEGVPNWAVHVRVPVPPDGFEATSTWNRKAGG